MKKEHVFEKLGLRQDEASIYSALLSSEPETVSGIAKLTGLHRPTIYRILPRLIERGLIAVVPHGKQKRFAAESPEKLKTLLDKVAGDLQGAIPELMRAFSSQHKKPVVKFLEGRNGIMSVFEDLVLTLHRGDVFYRYSSGRDVKKNEYYLPKNYRDIRDQKQLERFVITNAQTAGTKKPRMERGMKVIPKDLGLFDYDITEIIYGDKIAFVDYNTETAFIVENPMKILYERL
jgi:sugar-specific transcriptional regulator TrmB